MSVTTTTSRKVARHRAAITGMRPQEISQISPGDLRRVHDRNTGQVRLRIRLLPVQYGAGDEGEGDREVKPPHEAGAEVAQKESRRRLSPRQLLLMMEHCRSQHHRRRDEREAEVEDLEAEAGHAVEGPGAAQQPSPPGNGNTAMTTTRRVRVEITSI